MTFELFEHKADIGVRGIGATREEAFSECARALFEAMVDTKRVHPLKNAKLVVHATDLCALLIAYLNELLFLKDTKKMVYSKFRVKIKEVGESAADKVENEAKLGAEKGFMLEGVVFGEKFDAKKHAPKTDAKAATYSQMLVEKRADSKWVAQCIIDV